MNPILQSYIPVVHFIASIIGPNCEVLLHDISNPEHSIVAIANGHISGREVGGPLTELALKMIKRSKQVDDDGLVNYGGKTNKGNITRSSTLLIRDPKKELIGLICVNVDISCFLTMQECLNTLIALNPAVLTNSNGEEPEEFPTAVEDLMHNLLQDALNNIGVVPERMTTEEKVKVVSILHGQGVFLLKGAISEVATKLGISEATVYRYLGKLH